MKRTEELEVKLRVGPGFRLPALPGERLPPRTLTSVYLDTPDHRLAVAGVTLRRRVQGREGRWQLKLPRGEARLELELPAARPGGARRSGAPEAPPARLVDLVTAWSRGLPLVPAATLRTRRQGLLVRDIQGPLAEVVLDSVQVLEGSGKGMRFREVEVERRGGSEADLDRVVQALRGAGATEGDGRPKLLQALGLDPVPPPGSPTAESPGPERLRALIALQLHQIVIHDPGTRLGEDPEALHQMRVASRRLRAFLREAGAMLAPAWAEPLGDELAWLGDELGVLRDLDVLRERLSEEIAGLGAAEARGGARLLRALDAERAGRRASLLAALRSERYLRLLATLDEGARAPRIADPEVSLTSIARDAWKRLRRAAEGLGDAPSDAALHGVRIKAKRARYAAELVVPEGSKKVRRFLDRVREFQDLLGEHQDAVVAGRRLRELAGQARGRASAFAAGGLVERARARRAEILSELPRRWRKLEKRGMKAWR
jgi:CHAD domain-containing protein